MAGSGLLPLDLAYFEDSISARQQHGPAVPTCFRPGRLAAATCLRCTSRIDILRLVRQKMMTTWASMACTAGLPCSSWPVGGLAAKAKQRAGPTRAGTEAPRGGRQEPAPSCTRDGPALGPRRRPAADMEEPRGGWAARAGRRRSRHARLAAWPAHLAAWRRGREGAGRPGAGPRAAALLGGEGASLSELAELLERLVLSGSSFCPFFSFFLQPSGQY